MLKSTLAPTDPLAPAPTPEETAESAAIADAASPATPGIETPTPTLGTARIPAVDVREADAVIEGVTNEFLTDPAAIGLLLHGSRASGSAHPDSNYDFACLLTDDAFEQRRQRGTSVERRFHTGSPPVEISYEGVGTFRRAARLGSRRAARFAFARVLVDKTGEIAPALAQLVAAAEPDLDAVANHYDRYLHGFAHSLKAWSRGDDLGARGHAAQSGLDLVGALYALEGKPAPYLDHLSIRLAELDASQGWRSGFLPSALHRLFYAPDPPFQQMLERRVSRLMESRGVLHRWRHDLDRLRTVSYDEL
jgi:hypothetical protein